MDFLAILEAALLQNQSFVSEDGGLVKAKVYDAAIKPDADLLRLLANKEELKQHFFAEVEGMLIFDKVKFAWVLESREFLPDSYTMYKNKIGLADSTGALISQKNDVALVWPYKDCVLEGGQTKEDKKREEIFYNEVLAPDEVTRLLYPKVFTKAKRYTVQGEESITEFSDADNLIIKGNNLLVLSSLIRRYEGQVQCIYIDPPFNTGNDSFEYNDKFPRSSWLTFMKNRLLLAERLLKADGNIFIHIDDNQSHYLKILCDEVFGEENFVEEIIWAYGSPSGGRAATAKPVNIHDYILHYAKRYEMRKQNRIYVPYSEKYIQGWFKYQDEDGRQYRRRQRGHDADGNALWVKQYLDESKGVPLSTVWTDIQQVYADPRAYKESNIADVEVIKGFKGGQKPEALIQRILEMTTDKGDLVLDFYLGTGTTAAACHKIQRQYIGVEQMDSQIDISLQRLSKVIRGETAGISKSVNWQGGGSFVYCELDERNEHLVQRLQEADSGKDVQEILDYAMDNGLLRPSVLPDDLISSREEFFRLTPDEQKRLVMELIDKNKLYINLCDLEDAMMEVSQEDKAFNRSFYWLDATGGETID